MIIHDLRSPTSQIKHAASNITASIEYLQGLSDEVANLIQDDRVLLENLEDVLSSVTPANVFG